MTNLEVVLKMFKKADVSQYILEKELGEYLEGTVHISASRSKDSSFGVFIVPDFSSPENKLEYYIDIERMSTLFSDEEIIRILGNILSVKYKVLMKLFDFLKNPLMRTKAMLMGQFLSFYADYRGKLDIVNDIDWLPADDEILRFSSQFLSGEKISYEEKTEELILGGYIPAELPKKISENVGAFNFKVIDSDKEIPTENYFFMSNIEYVTSTFGIRDHKELPPDYLPKTNQ